MFTACYKLVDNLAMGQAVQTKLVDSDCLFRLATRCGEIFTRVHRCVKISHLVNRLVARQGCHSQLVDKSLNCRTTITKVVGTTCNKSVALNNLVASCQLQAVDNLSTSWEQAVRTHPVDNSSRCWNSIATSQVCCWFVCFYVFPNSSPNEPTNCLIFSSCPDKPSIC
jgi:hypothetical protein